MHILQVHEYLITFVFYNDHDHPNFPRQTKQDIFAEADKQVNAIRNCEKLKREYTEMKENTDGEEKSEFLNDAIKGLNKKIKMLMASMNEDS